jgi:hypothetical protein
MAQYGSNYLDGAEGLYGLPSPLPAGVAEQASVIVDSYIKRPEGLIYVPDKNGNPCYMKALVPSFTYKAVGAIAAGLNVAVAVTPPNVRQDMIGEVLILDRANPDKLEAVVVVGIVGNSQVVLDEVQFAHDAGVSADMGLVITEERNCPQARSVVRYAKFPCVSIISLMGRYGYGRRSTQFGSVQPDNLLTSVLAFGGPPQWTPISIAQTSWSDATGEIWVPAGGLLAYYSDVRIKYVAGYTDVPDPVLRATASIVMSLISSTTSGGSGYKRIQAGDTRLDRFGPTNMDTDARNELDYYRSRLFY